MKTRGTIHPVVVDVWSRRPGPACSAARLSVGRRFQSSPFGNCVACFRAMLLLAAAGMLTPGLFPLQAAQTARSVPLEELLTSELPGQMYEKKGDVRYKSSTGMETNSMLPQLLGFGEQLRTLALSGAALRMRDQTHIRMKELTRLQIQRRLPGTNAPLVRIHSGQLYVISHAKTTGIPFETAQVRGVPEGTEFLIAVDAEANRTEFTMFDGEVELSNDVDPMPVRVRSGQQGIAVSGERIRVVPIIEARNIIQWWIYYPGVLDLRDLELPAEAREKLAGSLADYAAGSLAQALEKFPGYPEPATPATDGERIYLASLLLAVGAVQKAEVQLAGTDPKAPGTRALRTMLKAVAPDLSRLTLPPEQATAQVKGAEPETASEWLARSYEYQAAHQLERALAAARASVQRSPDFAFGWARVAELEFSLGHTSAARRAIQRALELGPRNAQAHAVNGFLLAAENRIKDAITEFDNAIELDSALGNAWLGRGLCRIRRGDKSGGREDLLTAAALEPQRSLLRSYLGKAFGDAGEEKRALHELDLARQLDPADPTPWLYSALLLHDNYQTADAIHNVEKSQELNDNRAVYRSRLLLDQDQAVRSANLANIFEDAGMSDVSVRESARAVSFDYANFSAHLNLASSFNQLRDPTRFNLRYESEWFNEHLLASLLAPVGAGSLSQNLSQQEYSQLFAGKRFGLNGTTEYRSDGEWRQLASHFGTLGDTSYALDLDYQHKNGVRINNDLERIEWYTRIKQQFGSQDSALVIVKYQDYDAGDNYQYYDPDASARPGFRLEETQAPLLLAGWHHEWSPGIHTLFLGGRLVNDQHASDTGVNELAAIINPPGMFDPTNVVPFDVDYHSEFVTYTAELNQIFQRARHTDILGVRYQDGNFEADASLDNPPPAYASWFVLPENSATDTDFQRLSVYAYHHWEIIDNLMLVGGVAYDALDYPANFRRPPLESKESDKEHWSPKAALIWDITPRVRARGMFSQAVGGVSYDESVRLEPTQLAGFGQSFRSVISESLVGSVEAPDYQIAGGALDLRPGTNTWLSLQGVSLRGEVKRDFGIFDIDFMGSPPGTQANTVEEFDYQEWQARAVLNQIVGRDWFLEAQYQFTRSELERELPTIAATPGFDRTATSLADLHQGGLAVIWRPPKGFFARGEFWWFAQDLGGDGQPPPGDSFPQVNLYAGYRFPKRRAELTVGVLNLTDEDYHLSPLNYYLELPRERVLYVRFRFNF